MSLSVVNFMNNPVQKVKRQENKNLLHLLQIFSGEFFVAFRKRFIFAQLGLDAHERMLDMKRRNKEENF